MIFKRDRRRTTLPPGYEIRRAGRYVNVYNQMGWNLGLARATELEHARRMAWDDYEGRGRGSVLERGEVIHDSAGTASSTGA